MGQANSNGSAAPYVAIGVSLIVQIMGFVWWGSQLSQRVTTLENQNTEVKFHLAKLIEDNAGQASDIAVSNSQYREIIARLNRIDAKLDRLR